MTRLSPPARLEPLLRTHALADSPSGITSALLTGGGDKPYAFGLTKALSSTGVALDVIAGNDLDVPELRGLPKVRLLNLRGDQGNDATLFGKVARVARYYGRLIGYAATSNALVFHILWNNKIEFFDRTLLTLYYRLCGKRLILTVHNVNARRRDGNDSWFNRLTLRIQYHLMHHIFVHTNRMKDELITDFGLSESSVTVIPFGINNAVPQTATERDEARLALGIDSADKTILFFGTIAPYKGLEYLVDAFHRLVGQDPSYRLVIAGKPRPGDEQYWRSIADSVERGPAPGRVLQHIRFIPDQETEHYFKAADVAILPYTHIFQSGVLFLAYSFGLPVIAADVGDLKEDILIGETGDVFPPKDTAALMSSIQKYFSSNVYRELGSRRAAIRSYANAQHSWDTVAERTITVYRALLPNAPVRVVDTA